MLICPSKLRCSFLLPPAFENAILCILSNTWCYQPLFWLPAHWVEDGILFWFCSWLLMRAGPFLCSLAVPISSSVSFTVIIWFTFCHLDHIDNLLYCFLQWFLVLFCFVFWAVWPQSPLYTHVLPRIVWPCSPPMPASHCSWGHRCDHAVMFSSFSIL